MIERDRALSENEGRERKWLTIVILATKSLKLDFKMFFFMRGA